MIPTDVAGLVAWHTAKLVTGFAVDALVDTMNDQSGNGWHVIATTVAQYPTPQSVREPAFGTFHGYPVIRFNKTPSSLNQMISNVGVPAQTTATLYVAFAKRSVGTFPNDGVWAREGAFLHLLTHGEASGKYVISQGTALEGPAYRTNEFVLVEVVFNGASSTIRVNQGDPVTGDSGSTQATGRIIIGAEIDGANFGDIDFGESAYYSGVLAASDRAALRTYFMQGWPIERYRGALARTAAARLGI
jgi:hypothetical protein